MNDFLLELLVEEIPARMQIKAVAEFESLMVKNLQDSRISFDKVRSFVSPRRIVFSAKLSDVVEEYVEEKKGPQTTAPENIIERFCLSNNVLREDCIEKTIDKKNFVFVNIMHSQQSTIDLLPKVIESSIISLSWAKSMHWGSSLFHFVRPIRNIMAIFNGKLVDVRLNEIGLQSKDHTLGHRFIAPDNVFATNIDEYISEMKKSSVIVDREERKSIILNGFENIENSKNVKVDVKDSLLDEVVGLVEYPIVMFGVVPERFMKLPEEVITTVMQKHQRYFSTRTRDNKLAPYFVFVANNKTDDNGSTIIKGNERVLNARLADALFFFETDLKRPLESHLDDLKKITFQEKLGTVYDRVERLISICDLVHKDLRKTLNTLQDVNLVRRAATLAKCDLSTGMVCEFTELQGIMGSYYAQQQGEDNEVCRAIREQYLTADDITSQTSALLSIADKIEIITSFFSIGKEPTGSKDPFALRRAAIGLIKLIKKFNFTLDINAIVNSAVSALDVAKENTADNVMRFIRDRFKVLLKDSGINHDIAEFVSKNETDILLAYKKAESLQKTFNSDDGVKFITEYRRMASISCREYGSNVDVALFKEIEEKTLFDSAVELENKLRPMNVSIQGFGKLDEQIKSIVMFLPKLDEFFNCVLVNDSDEQIRVNRHRLLNKVQGIFDTLNLRSAIIGE